MKFNIEIDCTPDEARHFLGLPDVAPMQQRLIAEMEERMRQVVRDGDAKMLLEQWMPVDLKGVEQWQSIWTQLAGAAAGFRGPNKPAGTAGGNPDRGSSG